MPTDCTGTVRVVRMNSRRHTSGITLLRMSHNNNNNSQKPSKTPRQKKKSGNPRKVRAATSTARYAGDLARLRKDLALDARNPQALERRTQARLQTAMARGTRIDVLRLNHDARSLSLINNPVDRMHQHVIAWVKQQSYPSRHSGVHPLYTDNPCASVQVAPARTVRMDNMTVLAGQCRQLSLFARGPSNEGVSTNDTYISAYANQTGLQDAVAFHTRPFCYRDSLGNGNIAAIFPIPCTVPQNVAGVIGLTTFGTGCLGLMSESIAGIGLGSGDCLTDLKLATTTIRWSRLPPTTGLPYSATSLGHARAIMTGLEVKIINTTPQGSRAGTVVSVTLPHNFSVVGMTQQQVFAKFKTYKVHAIDDEITIVIPTRPIDMAYQHPNVDAYALGASGAANVQTFWESVYCASVNSAASHIWFNNPSATNQTYTYEITADWSIAGDLVAGISEEAPLNAAAKPLVQAASVVQSSAPHTTPAQVGSSFAKAASDTVESSFKGLAGKLAAYGVKKVGEALS